MKENHRRAAEWPVKAEWGAWSRPAEWAGWPAEAEAEVEAIAIHRIASVNNALKVRAYP